MFLTLMTIGFYCTQLHMRFASLRCYSSSSQATKKDGTNQAAIIGGYRAVTTQCRWNLTLIADQNNDTRLRNHESIIELILNSWRTVKRVSPTPSTSLQQYFPHVFGCAITCYASRRDEKCFCRASDMVLPTMKGKTGHEIDTWRLPDISAEKCCKGVGKIGRGRRKRAGGRG